MDFLKDIFAPIFYQPLLNALIFLYQSVPGKDFGVAIIILTIVIRLILYPAMAKSIKSQKELSSLQPIIQEIQQKFKEDKQRIAKETMALYQKAKINPLSGCLPLLLQLPILYALWLVFSKSLQIEQMRWLYSFVPKPEAIDPTFLGFIDLSNPSIWLAILAGVSQFFQAKTMSSPRTSSSPGPKGQMSLFSGMMEKQMLYFFPVLIVVILLRAPSAIGLYWLVSNLFSIGQQYLILRKVDGQNKGNN